MEIVRNANSALMEDITSISSEEIRTSRTNLGRTPHMVGNSAIFECVKEDPEVGTRSLATILGCTHLAVLGSCSPSTTEKLTSLMC